MKVVRRLRMTFWLFSFSSTHTIVHNSVCPSSQALLLCNVSLSPPTTSILDTRQYPLDTLCSDHQVGIKVIDRRAQSANVDGVCVGVWKVGKRLNFITALPYANRGACR